VNKASKDKTAFWVPDGKKRFTVMPMGQMGARNAHPSFIGMAGKFEEKWNALFESITKKHKQVSWKWLQQRLEKQFHRMKDTNKGDMLNTQLFVTSHLQMMVFEMTDS
jgi:hypothetical protein